MKARAPVAQTHPGGGDRNRDLQLIHIAKKQLNMDQDGYRAIVMGISNQRTSSSADLTAPERARLLEHLRACGFKAVPKKRSAPAKNVANSKQALMARLSRMLSEQGREWGYIDTVAARMFKVARAEWCDQNQLHSLVGILAKDARRHSRPV